MINLSWIIQFMVFGLPPCPKSEQLMTWGLPASEPRAKMLKSSSMHTSTTAARDIWE